GSHGLGERAGLPRLAVHGRGGGAAGPHRRRAGGTVVSRAWKLGADVDTDQLVPGATMKFGLDVIARHVLEAVRPDFAGGVRRGDVIVAGPNFGIGSSREQAASALVHLG